MNKTILSLLCARLLCASALAAPDYGKRAQGLERPGTALIGSEPRAAAHEGADPELDAPSIRR
jgi:hypothetical protein